MRTIYEAHFHQDLKRAQSYKYKESIDILITSNYKGQLKTTKINRLNKEEHINLDYFVSFLLT
jgi:hypothetical protein